MKDILAMGVALFTPWWWLLETWITPSVQDTMTAEEIHMGAVLITFPIQLLAVVIILCMRAYHRHRAGLGDFYYQKRVERATNRQERNARRSGATDDLLDALLLMDGTDHEHRRRR